MTGSFLRSSALRIISCATVGLTLSLVFAAAAEANGGGVTNPTACGQVVTGKVVLTMDLLCADEDGLVVGGPNTKIYLNGFSIKCMDLADLQSYKFSCQGGDITNNVDGTTPPGNTTEDSGPTFRSHRDIGIDTQGYSGVEIHGPGQIQSFDVGIFLDGFAGPCLTAHNVKVKKVNVTGPDGRSDITPSLIPRPPQTFGILVQDFIDNSCTCSSWNQDDGHGHGVEIRSSMVDNHAEGIALYNSSRVKVHMNFVHDVNDANDSLTQVQTNGIVVCADDPLRPAPACNPGISEKNLITQNLIVDNGQNYPGSDIDPPDMGILLAGNALFNRVMQNNVLANNGDGIGLQGGADFNRIIKNTSLYNTTTDETKPPMYDISNRSGGPNNEIKENNNCLTQGGVVQPGVCAPDENEAWHTSH